MVVDETWRSVQNSTCFGANNGINDDVTINRHGLLEAPGMEECRVGELEMRRFQLALASGRLETAQILLNESIVPGGENWQVFGRSNGTICSSKHAQHAVVYELLASNDLLGITWLLRN